MKCQKCGLNNANINYTQIINGRRAELHLCSECAHEMNLNLDFNFGDVFQDMLHDFAGMRSLRVPDMLGFGDFSRNFDNLFENNFFDNVPFFTGRLLEDRKDDLEETLNSIQKKHKKSDDKVEKRAERNAEHKNEIKDKKQNEIEQLKAKLQEYIKQEEYEKAAVIRDKIKELEK